MGGGGIWGGRTSPKDTSPDSSLLWMKEAMGRFTPVKIPLMGLTYSESLQPKILDLLPFLALLLPSSK